MGSRLFVSALVVTALSVAPAAAVVCETFCVDHAASHASGHESAHASHVHGADTDGTAATVTSGAHDCNSHDRIAASPSKLGRPTSSVDSPPVVLFEPGSAARRMAFVGAPVGAAHRPTHPPAVTTVSVLRI